MTCRVVDQLRENVSSLADEVLTVSVGWLARTRSLPRVHTLNQLHVTAPSTADLVLAVAEEHQVDLPYRHVVVDVDDVATRLVARLQGSDWMIDRDVIMAFLAGPDRDVDTEGVTDLTEAEMVAVMRRWHVEDRPNVGRDILDQLDEYNRRAGALWNESRFGVRDPSGAPVAITKLRTPDEDCGWVEDVYTVPEERGKGHARRLVTHATRQAASEGRRLTYILADDNDWPKNLYAQIGFRPIGVRWSFHREVATAAAGQGHDRHGPLR